LRSARSSWRSSLDATTRAAPVLTNAFSMSFTNVPTWMCSRVRFETADDDGWRFAAVKVGVPLGPTGGERLLDELVGDEP